jgi:phage terminase large subunit GpA-like protein
MSLRHETWPEIIGAFSGHFRPPEALSTAEWNQKYRRLPDGLAFVPWPWQIEPMNAGAEPEVGEIILMMAAQLCGKSEILLSILAHQIVSRPADYLLVMPTLPQAERWSRTRWANTVKWSPVLQELLPGENRRTLASSGSKLLFKHFTNGANLAIATANSAAALSAASIRGLYADETDLWPRELLDSGSPFALAARRLTAFPDSIFVQASTPTIAGESHIESEFGRSDRRRWQVPCPSCGESFLLRWSRVIWSRGESGKHRPETARIKCPSCGAEHDDATRRLMVLNGRWAPENPEQKRVRGYWLSGMNALVGTRKGFVSRLHEQAVEFLEARGNPVTLAPWVNSVAGESFVREKIKALPIEFLLDRREDYFEAQLPDPASSVLPESVLGLTGGVDVQQRHIESLIIGWTKDKSSYVVDHRTWPGNPTQADAWQLLGEYLSQSWQTTKGDRLPVAMSFCDSGFLPGMVHEFCRAGPHRWPTKGIASVALPWVERSGDKKKRMILIHTDAGKFLFYSRLAIDKPDQAGFIHLHNALDEEFCRQLLAETAVEDRRAKRLVFRLVSDGVRNEALDLFILAMAAAEWIKFPFERLDTSEAHPGQGERWTRAPVTRRVDGTSLRQRVRRNPFKIW